MPIILLQSDNLCIYLTYKQHKDTLGMTDHCRQAGAQNHFWQVLKISPV